MRSSLNLSKPQFFNFSLRLDNDKPTLLILQLIVCRIFMLKCSRLCWGQVNRNSWKSTYAHHNLLQPMIEPNLVLKKFQVAFRQKSELQNINHLLWNNNFLWLTSGSCRAVATTCFELRNPRIVRDVLSHLIKSLMSIMRAAIARGAHGGVNKGKKKTLAVIMRAMILVLWF